MSEAYRRAGVDIEAGEAVVRDIGAHVRRTRRPEVIGKLGGFGALCGLPDGYSDPVLVSGTDGVGTKLLVAQRLGRHRSIGIDLVAMCVNDIATLGAEPLFFLDYFATGKLAPEVAVEVVAGIADGCLQAGCALVGGETAEMPGLYAPGHYDLAGFCVGVVERGAALDGSRTLEGDLLVGLPSSGIHSNGYSLVRQICDPLDWSESHGLDSSLGDMLLRPTRIYVSECLRFAREFGARGMAHITGGGILENIPRVLPEGLGARLEPLDLPPLFSFLQERGGLADTDMHRTFNCGLGMVAVLPRERAAEAASALGGSVVGEVVAGSGVLWA